MLWLSDTHEEPRSSELGRYHQGAASPVQRLCLVPIVKLRWRLSPTTTGVCGCLDHPPRQRIPAHDLPATRERRNTHGTCLVAACLSLTGVAFLTGIQRRTNGGHAEVEFVSRKGAGAQHVINKDIRMLDRGHLAPIACHRRVHTSRRDIIVTE